MEELLRQIGSGVSDAELDALVAEARAAALADVRELLRGAFVAELLGRLAAQGELLPPEGVAAASAEAAALSPRPSADAPVAPAATDLEPAPAPLLPQPSADVPVDELAAELAALRSQLAANRSWLGGDLDGAPDDTPAPCPALLPASPRPSHVSLSPWLTPSPPDTLLWLYAVRRASVDIIKSTEPIEGVAEGENLFAIRCGDLEAVASVVPAADFGEGPIEANLRDLGWLERVARSHQAALAALMAEGTLVPLRFASLFSGPERVAAMVAERADELRAALGRLEGRGEWGVKLHVDEAALAERLADASPAVRELRERIAAKPAGAAYLLQKQLERLAAEEARRVSDACADEAHARLGAASVAATRGALRDSAGGVMLLNGAYLVDDAAQPAFAGAIEALRAEYGPLGFDLELTGPWPPYSFAAPWQATAAVEGSP